MGWIWKQTAGELWHGDAFIARGYSGYESGKNNPAWQHEPNVGPIPQGTWSIGAPRQTQTHGPYVLPLTPEQETDTFGRSAFLIHGDSVAHPGTASRGCIILPRPVRETIWLSGEHVIAVIA